MLHELVATPMLGMSLLQLDSSLFIQLALFLLLMFVLNRILFRPVLESMQMRADRNSGRRAEARQLRKQADELSTSYRQTLEQVKQEAQVLKAGLIKEGKEQEHAILDEVRRAARASLELAEAERGAAMAAARTELASQVEPLAREVVRRVLRQAPLALLLVGGALLCWGFPAMAWASGDAQAATGGLMGWLANEYVQLGGWALNFLLLIWLLVRFGRQPIRQGLAGRREKLVADLAEAARMREEAADLLEDARTRIAGLEEERKTLLETFRIDGQRERERLIAEARQQAERIRTDIAAAIDLEARRAASVIQLELIDQVLRRAEAQLRRELTVEEDTRQLESIIAVIGQTEPAPPAAPVVKG